MEFKEKFIAFIDILGFKQLVASAESGEEFSLSEIISLLDTLGAEKSVGQFKKYGPTTCPESLYLEKGLDFQITQISDCVIVSSEISPAGAVNIISHCWGAVLNLMLKGIMCRGYITKGMIFHQKNQVIGSGYQEAFANESQVTSFQRYADEKGTPFVEIDSIVHQFILDTKDECVRKMYQRMIKSDGVVTALFPFQRLSHSFGIGGIFGEFEPEKEKDSNNIIREILKNTITKVKSFVDLENDRAVEKAEHYVQALEEQLSICDKTDQMIDRLCSPAVPAQPFDQK